MGLLLGSWFWEERRAPAKNLVKPRCSCVGAGCFGPTVPLIPPLEFPMRPLPRPPGPSPPSCSVQACWYRAGFVWSPDLGAWRPSEA